MMKHIKQDKFTGISAYLKPSVLILLLFLFILYHFSIHKSNDFTNDGNDGINENDLIINTVNRSVIATRIIIIGDYGTFDRRQKKVAKAVQSYILSEGQPDFVISVGDSFYSYGVKNVEDKMFGQFQKMYNRLGKNINWYPSLGNHDCAGNISALLVYNSRMSTGNENDLSPNWVFPDRYYSYDVHFTGSGTSKNKSIHIITLDGCMWVCREKKNIDAADPLNLCTDPLILVPNDADEKVEEQKRWLVQELEKARKVSSFVIVNAHWPIYSLLSGHGPTDVFIKELRPILLKYKVDLFVFGHDHGLQLLSDSSSLLHLGSGGGGYTLHEKRKPMWPQITEAMEKGYLKEEYFSASFGFWVMDVFQNSTYNLRAYEVPTSRSNNRERSHCAYSITREM